MKLLLLFYNTFSKMLKKKPPFQPKTPRFCTTCSIFGQSIWLYNRLSLSSSWSFHMYDSGCALASSVLKVFKRSTRLEKTLDYQSSKIMMQRLRRYNWRTYQKTRKMQEVYSNIIIFRTSQGSFKPNELATIIITR